MIEAIRRKGKKIKCPSCLGIYEQDAKFVVAADHDSCSSFVCWNCYVGATTGGISSYINFHIDFLSPVRWCMKPCTFTFPSMFIIKPYYCFTHLMDKCVKQERSCVYHERSD